MDPYRDIAQYYDVEHSDFRDDIEFYLNVVKDGPVLVIGCGTGRVTAALLDSGLEVWGIDSSPSMIGKARERLGQDSKLRLVCTSMQTLSLNRRFPVCILPLNTLWHCLHREAQIEGLTAVHAHLTARGTLLIDVSNPLTMVDRGAEGEMRERFSKNLVDGVVRGSSAAWDDEAEQTLAFSLTYEESRADKSMLTTARLRLRYLYRFELELLLRLCGFDVRTVYGSYDLDPYGSSSPRILTVATPLCRSPRADGD